MAEFTEIQWCDGTLNLWWGCTKVSDGCKFCYAETLSDQRYKKGAWGPKGTRQEIKSWRSTLEKISKRAKTENRRLRVFCQSMSDTFEGPETCGGVDSDNWRLMERLRANLFYEIPRHPHLDFLLLTKRPQNIERTVRDCWSAANRPGLIMPPNAWFGTSVENQEQADQRIPYLLRIPAKVRFLSCEPLLGPVDLSKVSLGHSVIDCLTGRMTGAIPGGEDEFPEQVIQWVICGGESGKDARPMKPEWARSLRDQCQLAEVAFHFKQWGEWLPECHVYDGGETGYGRARTHHWEDAFSWKVGKKAAGRLLDGREWNEFPRVAP